MRNLRFRRAARTSALGTVAVLAALSLTACQGDDTAAFDAASPAPATSQSASGDNGSAAPAAPAADKDKAEDATNSTAGSGSSSGSDKSTPATKQPQGNNDGPVTRQCDSTNTKLTMTEVKRPINHMLLTVTNTGSKACNAYYFPYLKFGDAQAVPQTVEDSKPQAVTTINPGESAYAGVLTSSADGSGTGGYSTKDLQVGFQGRNGGSDTAGPMVEVPLSKSVYVDSTLAVTYWQTSMNDALTY